MRCSLHHILLLLLFLSGYYYYRYFLLVYVIRAQIHTSIRVFLFFWRKKNYNFYYCFHCIRSASAARIEHIALGSLYDKHTRDMHISMSAICDVPISIVLSNFISHRSRNVYNIRNECIISTLIVQTCMCLFKTVTQTNMLCMCYKWMNCTHNTDWNTIMVCGYFARYTSHQYTLFTHQIDFII